MERLGVYAFYDKANDVFYGFCTSSGDDVGAKFLVNNAIHVIEDLNDNKQLQDSFISNMSCCDVYRLGWINIENGSLDPDKCLLSTFQDFDFKKVINKKIEVSEVSDNV